MTPDALTQARVQEAIRIVGEQGDLNHYGAEVALAMARLISEDWRPVDPLMADVEQITKVVYSRRGYNPSMEHAPDCIAHELVLKGLVRGIDIGQNEKHARDFLNAR